MNPLISAKRCIKQALLTTSESSRAFLLLLEALDHIDVALHRMPHVSEIPLAMPEPRHKWMFWRRRSA